MAALQRVNASAAHSSVQDDGSVGKYEIGDRSTDNYDIAKEKLGDVPIEGLIVHTAGLDDDRSFEIVDVWESREHVMERVMATVGNSPEAFPRPDTFAPPIREAHYELHDLVKG